MSTISQKSYLGNMSNDTILYIYILNKEQWTNNECEITLLSQNQSKESTSSIKIQGYLHNKQINKKLPVRMFKATISITISSIQSAIRHT